MVCQSRGQDQGFFTGEEDTDDAEKIILKTEDGQNVKSYPCTPCIVGTWKDAYETEKNCPESYGRNRRGRPAVCADTEILPVCAYGGLIEPVTSGQEEMTREEMVMAQGYRRKQNTPDYSFWGCLQ